MKLKNIVLSCVLSFVIVTGIAPQVSATDEIHNAAMKGDWNEVKEQLDRGVNVNVKDRRSNDWTPLWYAMCFGKMEVFKHLLECPNIDVNTQDNAGWTVLMMAAANDYIEMVALLLDHPEINLNLKNKYGETALDSACTVEIKQLIRDHINQQERIEQRFKVTKSAANTAPRTRAFASNFQ